MKNRNRLYHVTLVAALAVVLAGCTSTAVDPPEPGPSGALTQDEEYAQSIAACLNDARWDVTYSGRDNSITSTHTESQDDRYQSAYDDCASATGIVPRQLSELTDDEWSNIYQQELDTAECLRGQGIDVPEAPSQQAFRDAYGTNEGWQAWLFVDVGQSRYYELLELCPQPTI